VFYYVDKYRFDHPQDMGVVLGNGAIGLIGVVALQRWTARLLRMPTQERQALLAAIGEAWRIPASPEMTIPPAASPACAKQEASLRQGRPEAARATDIAAIADAPRL
jgi:hypothetical protein